MRQRTNALVRTAAILLAGACDKNPCCEPPSSHLAFLVQPSTAAAGTIFSPVVQVAAQDAAANTVTTFNGLVTLALGADPGGGMLVGTTVLHAVNGVATFSAVRIDKIGAGYTLTATATGLTGATSAPFDVAVGPATQLAFTVQPSRTNMGAAIAPAIQVTAQDAGGNPTPAFAGTVTIAIGKNVGGAALAGTDSAAAVNGVATFSNLSLDQAGTGYTLVATATGLAAATSAAFDVALVPPNVHITTSTTGAALPIGYSLCLDYFPPDPSYPRHPPCSWSGTIGVNSAVTVPVTPGGHSVRLNQVPGNCVVSGANPRAVTVSGTTEVPFSVSCLDTGSVHVTIGTTGIDIDPNGYVVCVDRAGNSCFWGAPVQANDVVTISGVTAEAHSVTISNVVDNCTVSGDTTQALMVLAHTTADVTFTVGCVVAERIAFSSSGTIKVIRLDRVGAPIWVTSGFSPAWSPAGTRLAYECGLDICAINPDGSGLAQLTTNGAVNRHPTWSPDGTKIAFSAAPSGVPDLWVMAADGSGAVRLTQNAGFVGSPAWSPDGTKIAFDCQVAPANDDICVVNTDGTGFARLTSDPARDYGAAWKQDGSTLAFATTRFGVDEVVLMSASGGNVTRIGAGLAGSKPTWSPDGSELAFVRLDQLGSPNILAAHVDGSTVVTVVPGDQPAWRPHP